MIPKEYKIFSFFIKSRVKLAASATGGPSTTPDEFVFANLYAPDFIALSEKKPWKNPFVLHEKYVVEGLSMAQIARQFLCSRNAIRAALVEAKIPIRSCADKDRTSTPRYGTKIIKGKRIDHKGEQKIIQTIIELREEGLSYEEMSARF